ncbi:hypothetical protein LCGC14_1704010, partial [marine sediment metagenome]
VRIAGTGNLGVGTTTPSSLFSVGSGIGFQVNDSGQVVKGTWLGTAIGDGYLTKTGNWTGVLDGWEGSLLFNVTSTQMTNDDFGDFSCDGTDQGCTLDISTGGSNWQFLTVNAIRPTSTAVGIIINASSTINHNLTVGTSTALYVDSGNGRVGIGTTTPAEALEVVGSIKLDDEIMGVTSTVTFDGDTSSGLKLTNPRGYITLTPLNSGWAHIYTDRNNFIFNKNVYSITDTFSSYDADLKLDRAGTTKITVGTTVVTMADDLIVSGNTTTTDLYATGNVGIGTTTPAYPLVVNSASANAFYVESDGDIAVNGTTIYTDSSTFVLQDSNADEDFIFSVRSPLSGNNSAALQVYGESASRNMNFKIDGSANTGYIDYDTDLTSAADFYIYSDQGIILHLDDDNDATSVFAIYDGGNTERLNFSESGNLQMDGALTVDGGATFGGGYGFTGVTISSAGVVQMDGDLNVNGGNIYDAGTTSWLEVSSCGTDKTVTSVNSAGTLACESISIASGQVTDIWINELGDTTGNLTSDLNIDSDTFVISYDDNRVGIGTTGPDEKLHVEGNMMLDAYNNLGEGGGIFFREGFDSDDANPYNLSMTLRGWDTPVSPDGFLISGYDGIGFMTGTNTYATSNVRMLITVTGNVGIGTTTPEAIFSVNSAASNAFVVQSDGKVGIGTTAIPHGGVGYAKFAIEGLNQNAAGPHMQFTTVTNNYPLMQILNWTHNNVYISFDSYYDGSWRSSYPGSSFSIAKENDKFFIRYGISAAGAVVNWNEGIVLNATGDVGIGTALPDVLLDITGDYVASAGQIYVHGTTHAYIALDAATNSDSGILLKELTRKSFFTWEDIQFTHALIVKLP